MLKEENLKQLNALLETVSREELIWINGYLSGLVNQPANGHAAELSPSSATPIAAKKISLVYGTETGNAKRLATQLAAAARQRGVTVKLTSLDQYRAADMVKESLMLIVISTQGEGEPPLGAKKWYDHIHQENMPLGQLQYAVLGLGDTAYPLFCKTGEDVDLRLQQLGATRLLPLQKCDVDYEADARNWFNRALDALAGQSQSAAPQSAKPSATTAPQKAHTRKYYEGRVLKNINLNDRGSNKETYHIEIGVEEPVDYQPGDALAVVPRNRREVVDEILRLTGADENKVLATAKAEGTLRELLTEQLNICYLLGATIKKYAALTGLDIPDTRMDLVDLLRIYPVPAPEKFEDAIRLLTPIAPRLYSISSSPLAHENEIHITVARNEFILEQGPRAGLCSEYLGALPEGTELRFYIHANRNFKLPAADRDIIMIGPGTGVAPFRSFLYEREYRGDSGRNWFFFGEQHFISDFLYQTEMQTWLDTGVLQKLSLAFSRDQQQKIYVQHRMRERGKELFEWLEQGTHIYISGTKDPMSREVEETLIDIIEEFGEKKREDAISYWEAIKKDGRYQKDVY